MKRVLSVVLVIVLLMAAASAMLAQNYRQFTHAPMDIGAAETLLDVAPGDTLRTVLARLEEQGVSEWDWRWRILNRLRAATIKTGEYHVPTGMTPSQLLDMLASGKVVSYRFTIIEGWSAKQLLEALGANGVLRHTLQSLADLDGLAGLPAANPEGWFLPETYSFIRGDSDLQILQRAYTAMQETLADTWTERDIGLPYETAYEMLTMASIIEKETSIKDERADIAGVFVRRLQENWRLEADPTIIYGMGDSYQGDIRRKDIKQDTPYNTYTRRGLPPTPIAMPGAASIRAAAHPADGMAMFFVADGQGGHTFSETLDEHQNAVRELIKNSKRQDGNK